MRWTTLAASAAALLLASVCARADIPTGKQVADLFGFHPDVVLKAEAPPANDFFGFGKPAWYRAYGNSDATRFSIIIAAFDKGPTLNARMKKSIEDQIAQMKGLNLSTWPFGKRNPNFAFKTKDNRRGYNLLGGTLGGPDELTILPAQGKKHGLLIVMSYAKEDGVELEEQMKKGPRPSKSGFDVLESVEAIINSRTRIGKP